MISISPSLLPLPTSEIMSAAEKAIELGIERLHLDVIDGQFVNKYGLADDIMSLLLKNFGSDCKLDVHLMVNDPVSYIKKDHYQYASTIYIHQQQDHASHQTISDIILNQGSAPGLVINHNESINSDLINDYEYLLVMGVVPGLSGQTMLPNTYPKLKQLTDVKQNKKRHITLDGGVKESDLSKLSGMIDCVVMGSAIFNHTNWPQYLESLLSVK